MGRDHPRNGVLTTKKEFGLLLPSCLRLWDWRLDLMLKSWWESWDCRQSAASIESLKGEKMFSITHDPGQRGDIIYDPAG